MVDDLTHEQGYAHPILIQGVPLGPILAERVGLPVIVDNDAKAAAWAELKAPGDSGVCDFLMLTVGTRIGAGVVIDGKLYRGYLTYRLRIIWTISKPKDDRALSQAFR